MTNDWRVPETRAAANLRPRLSPGGSLVKISDIFEFTIILAARLEGLSR
jgi:hypothetical protein